MRETARQWVIRLVPKALRLVQHLHKEDIETPWLMDTITCPLPSQYRSQRRALFRRQKGKPPTEMTRTSGDSLPPGDSKLTPWSRYLWGALASCGRTLTWHGGWARTCTMVVMFGPQVEVSVFFGGGTRTYLVRTKGIGTQIRAKVPNTVDAHRGPRALYIFFANSYRDELANDALRCDPGGPAYRESSTKNTTDKELVRRAREPTRNDSCLRMTVLLARADAAANRYVSTI